MPSVTQEGEPHLGDPGATFRRDVQQARLRGEHLSLKTMAQLAAGARMSMAESIAAISAFGYSPPDRAAMDALAALIRSILASQGAKSSLEYNDLFSFVTPRVTEAEGNLTLTLMSINSEVCDALRIIDREKRATIVCGEDVPAGAQYNAIICSPPVGLRRKGLECSDGFGGEVVFKLLEHLAPGGIAFWITARRAMTSPSLASFSRRGKELLAAIELPRGIFGPTSVDFACLVLGPAEHEMKLVASIGDVETARVAAQAFRNGPKPKPGPNWAWIDRGGDRSYRDIEREELLKRLAPRGRYQSVSIGALLAPDCAAPIKADQPPREAEGTAMPLFVPEYAGSRVTADIAEQTVKLSAVYRLAIDPAKANAHFVAQILNSEFGKELRASAAKGATIQRVPARVLVALELPLPDLATQNRIVRMEGDVRLLQSALSEMRRHAQSDWSPKRLAELEGALDELKKPLDIEHKIAQWWLELPYPMATIYRRYQVATEPREKLEALLHFFEVSAIYLANLGTSHVRALHKEWGALFTKWFRPTGAAGIERADFGFWSGLAGASLKELGRIGSDKELRELATEHAGPELVQVGTALAPLGKATEALDAARRFRNNWIGHGGYKKPEDAQRILDSLEQPLRDFYEIAAAPFRRILLVRPGKAEVSETAIRFEVEKLAGSDPTFAKEYVDLSALMQSNTLAFWMRDARVMCRAMPLFRLGAPQNPRENSFYVFSRIAERGFRWICYQEASEQELEAPDDDLRKLIDLTQSA